ncbi:hypothetical protein C7C56_013400 [Massilia glaciei]|uniref:Uncharacterized protein n=1 Tax=Massilia glaciei TaxID=1524097 RepID=A0A2U2HK85_9BURK|nr:hypothetical protein C7C56_013400 [Massilia glaciei]
MATGLLGSLDALACRPSGIPERVPTKAELLAQSDMVFSGKVVDVETEAKDQLYGFRFEVANYIKGKGAATLRVFTGMPTTCPGDIEPLKVGEWWTVYVRRNAADGRFFIRSLDTVCAPGADPTPGSPLGYCSKVQTEAVKVDDVLIDAGSSVSFGPDRSRKSMGSVLLRGRSTFAGIALPAGTEWFPTIKQFRFSQEVAIGPARLTGQMRLMYIAAEDKIHGAYYAALDRQQIGNITLDGTPVYQVRFAAPGFAVLDATLDQPGVIRGIHVADYIRFSPSGKIASFRAGRDQVIDGVRLKRCDNVVLVEGRVVEQAFYNPCGASKQ